MFRLAPLLVFVSLFSVGVRAGTLQSSCEKMHAPVEWEYCVAKTADSKNTNLVYHLHGAGENVRTYLTSPRAKELREAWDKMGVDAPTVVTISFGPIWLLSSANASPRSGLYDLFTQVIMPHIEKNVLQGQVNQRYIFGYSMGGYNGSQLFLKNPELFRSVVLGCPAMSTISPYASDADIQDYIRRNNARPDLVEFMLSVVKEFYPDDLSYQVDAPISKAGKILGPHYPPVHISCGESDGFGFHEGALTLAQVAASRGANVTWQSLPGPHCVLDIPAIAQFLLQ